MVSEVVGSRASPLRGQFERAVELRDQQHRPQVPHLPQLFADVLRAVALHVPPSRGRGIVQHRDQRGTRPDGLRLGVLVEGGSAIGVRDLAGRGEQPPTAASTCARTCAGSGWVAA